MHAGGRITFPGFLWRNDTSFNIGRINGRSLASAAVFLARRPPPPLTDAPQLAQNSRFAPTDVPANLWGGGEAILFAAEFQLRKNTHTGCAKFNFERDNCEEFSTLNMLMLLQIGQIFLRLVDLGEKSDASLDDDIFDSY